MQDFVKANAGMFRRIDNVYEFENYSVTDIATILKLEVQKSGFTIDPRVTDKVRDEATESEFRGVIGPPQALHGLIDQSTTESQRAIMNGGLARQLFK